MKTVFCFVLLLTIAWSLVLLGFCPGEVGRVMRRILMTGEHGRGRFLDVVSMFPCFPGLFLVAFRESRRGFRHFVIVSLIAVIVAAISMMLMLYVTRDWFTSSEYVWWERAFIPPFLIATVFSMVGGYVTGRAHASGGKWPPNRGDNITIFQDR